MIPRRPGYFTSWVAGAFTVAWTSHFASCVCAVQENEAWCSLVRVTEGRSKQHDLPTQMSRSFRVQNRLYTSKSGRAGLWVESRVYMNSGGGDGTKAQTCRSNAST